MIERELNRRTRTAQQFFLLGAVVILLAVGGGLLLIQWFAPPPSAEYRFPKVFWLSSLALLTGSIAMHRAVDFVRREKQRRFRGQLLVALAAGMFFIMFQLCGMWTLLQARENFPIEIAAEHLVTTGTKPYVFVGAALHAMHFLVAILFQVYVTVNGFSDRYDHEVYFSVRFCAWFWHALGIIWLGLMFVFGFVFV